MVEFSIWRERRRKILKRLPGLRGYPKQRFLIICEGKKTEPNYFNSFRIPTVDVVVFGEGENTDRLVERAIEHRKEAKKNGEHFDQTWCVFDRDSFPAHNFNRALDLARNAGIRVAFSNEAFEIWYVLHFEYLCSTTTRTDLIKRLSDHLGKYEKNMPTIYDQIKKNQQIAIQRAKKLMDQYKPLDPCNNNPITTVFELVEELNNNI